MSHLGDLISAHVDGELSGAELDRVNGHLAACPQCQAEAARQRQLKHELRGYGGASCPAELTARLFAIGRSGPADPAGPHLLSRERSPGGEHGRRRRARTGKRRLTAALPAGRGRRGRYMVWSAVSLVVVGIGAAAFGLGGVSGTSGRQITPQQLEVFDIQHAITAGEVPFADPSESAAETRKP